MSRSHRITFVVAALAAITAAPLAQAQILPDDFERDTIASGLDNPVGIEFAIDGRIFIAEQRGMIWVIENGSKLATPFIDLRAEVNSQWDRGMLGIALDPDFINNRHVYMLYTVDPNFGKPDENGTIGTFARLTRYTGTVGSNGNVADLASRLVLLGVIPSEGIPVCDLSHANGDVKFGHDGSLFVSGGDAAHFENTDSGGQDPACFDRGMFSEDQDIGAFRSQYLQSLAGKVLRINPATGLGYPDNPHYTGDGSDTESKIWVNGLRNPYRFTVRPEGFPGPASPGTLYICDVGWNGYEEVNVAYGGENFGWPCREGLNAAPSYPSQNPDNGDCDTIETPVNPGPLTDPIIAWHHSNTNLSTPQGITGNAATGAAFYTHGNYPLEYHGALFFAELTDQWMRIAQTNATDELVSWDDFLFSAGRIVDVEAHPISGDIHYVAINHENVYRIRYTGTHPADLDEDGDIDAGDLAIMLGAWGPCGDCAADLNGDGVVNAADLAILLGAWGP